MVDYTKRLKNTKATLQTSDIISANKGYILRFIDRLSAEDISKVRQLKYLYTLKPIAIMLNKDFSQADKQDITELLCNINNSNYKDWTKRDFKVIIKRFYQWLRESEGQTFDRGEYPGEVKWINTGKKKDRIKLPNQLFTIEDVKKLSNHTNNLRDRCLILLLYESGARIGELMNIKLKDIDFDKYGALLTIYGKTGARKIRVIASSPAISNWLIEHPNRDDKELLLFCGIWSKKRGQEIGYNTFSKILKETAEKAGITKPVNPHHFRHSRATELAKKLTESQLCEYMGWVQGSSEAATYVHLSGRDMDKAILSLHGLLEEEKERDKFQIIECPRCGIKNDPGAKFCMACSLGLDEKSVMEYDKQKELNSMLGTTALENLTPELEKTIGNMIMEQIKKEKEKLHK